MIGFIVPHPCHNVDMVIRRALIRFLYILITLLVIVVLTGIIMLLESKIYAFNRSFDTNTIATPFPVGVNMATQVITEIPEVNEYFVQTLANETPTDTNWRDLVTAAFASKSWFQTLASPVQRIAVIWPGERHEEVVDHFGDILGWDKDERTLFANLIQSSDPILIDGKYEAS